MSLVSRFLVILFAVAISGNCEAASVLRLCADPKNLPYSNQAQQGFENHLAALIANDLGMRLSYFWYPQREKFFQKTLNADACDAVMSVPEGFRAADTTATYYRSSYVFVSRRDRRLNLSSLDDPRLKLLRVGVHVLGGETDSLPPVYALATRGIVDNVVSYSIFGNDLAKSSPAEDLLGAVINDKVDVAIVWGPAAGYFALHSSVPLEVTPIEADPKNPNLPFAFAIAIGVRKGQLQLKHQIDRELVRRRLEIGRLLRAYGIDQPSLTPKQPVGED